MFCTWSNLCQKTNICCNFCKETKCDFRCSDDCNTCRYLEDEEGNLINKFKSDKPLISKTKKHPAPSKKITTEQCAEKLSPEVSKFMVRINSGNSRGKTYYFESYAEAVAKAVILEKRQKSHRKSLIIKASIIDGKEFYPLSNIIKY